jgi:hypothetical protein
VGGSGPGGSSGHESAAYRTGDVATPL